MGGCDADVSCLELQDKTGRACYLQLFKRLSPIIPPNRPAPPKSRLRNLLLKFIRILLRPEPHHRHRSFFGADPTAALLTGSDPQPGIARADPRPIGRGRRG